MADNSIYVIKLSGSLFFSNNFGDFRNTISRISKQRNDLKLILICGGGVTARTYIEAGKDLGADQASLDEIGIMISRLNAMALVSALGEDCYDSVPEVLFEISEAIESKDERIVVAGGLHPGQSTNGVAAIVSEKQRADRFINATDVEGVFTKDPKKFRDAKILREVTVNHLQEILGNETAQAGAYDLMDPVALKILERSRIPTVILKCAPEILEDVILFGREHGTKVLS